MTKLFTLGIVLAAMLATASAGQANLLTNGSFEIGDATPGQIAPGTPSNALPLGGWNVYTSMPGWYTTQQTGFELQRNTIVTAAQGTNYIELESHPAPNSSTNILQSFQAPTTGIYTLSFAYQPRPNTSQSEETENLINVIFGGITTVITSPPQPFGVWSTIVITALLNAGTSILEFNAFNSNNNTVGGFIDNVSVTFSRNALPGEVPLPAGLLLLLTGLGGLGFLSRSRNKA